MPTKPRSTRREFMKTAGASLAIPYIITSAALGNQEIAPGYIAAAWKRADIIHVHHPHPLADLACLLRARRTPVVVTQHADSRRSVYRPATRLVLRRAAAVVVPSRAHLALSTELTGFESKVEVIPFGIDHTRWEIVPPPPPGARRSAASGGADG